MRLCLDEFERLAEVVGKKPETKPQLVQLMGLLRATIQHSRRVRLLVPIDDDWCAGRLVNAPSKGDEFWSSLVLVPMLC